MPLIPPLRHAGTAISDSSPCITDLPAPPYVVSSSSSSSSERNPPKIYIQDVKGETLPLCDPGLVSGVGLKGQRAEMGPEPMSTSSDLTSTSRTHPMELAREALPHRDICQEPPGSQASGVQPETKQGPNQSQRAWLSSSHSSIFSPSSDAGPSSSKMPLSNSSRGSRLRSSYEDLQTSAGLAAVCRPSFKRSLVIVFKLVFLFYANPTERPKPTVNVTYYK